MRPVISLITVCLNSEKTIGRTIESVLSQEYNALEYIIVDGGSRDDTLNIIEGYKERFDGSLRLVSEPDNGIYDAMNKGIGFASGDLVCMLNSDDWLEPGALEIVADVYEHRETYFKDNTGTNTDNTHDTDTNKDTDTGKGSYCVIYGLQRTIKDGKTVSCGFDGHDFLDSTNIPHQASYVSKAAYDKFGLYDTSYKCNSDHEFMLRLYTSDEVEFIPVEKVLVNFASGGMSSGYIGHIEDAKIRRKYGIIGRGQYAYLVFRAYFLRMIGRF